MLHLIFLLGKAILVLYDYLCFPVIKQLNIGLVMVNILKWKATYMQAHCFTGDKMLLINSSYINNIIFLHNRISHFIASSKVAYS